MQSNFVRLSRSDRYFVAAANGNPHYLVGLAKFVLGPIVERRARSASSLGIAKQAQGCVDLSSTVPTRITLRAAHTTPVQIGRNKTA